MRRVLVISHSWPQFPGPGAETRAFCLFKQLSQNFDLTFLLPHTPDNVKRDALQKLGVVHMVRMDKKWRRGEWRLHQIKTKLKQLQPYNPFWQRPQMVTEVEDIAVLMEQWLQNKEMNQYDLVHLFHPHLATIFASIDVPLPKTLDWVDERTAVLRRQKPSNLAQQVKNKLEIRRLEYYQHTISSWFNTSFVSSTIDSERLYHLTGIQPLIVPNGVNTNYFQVLPDSSKLATLVFSGHMAYEPNVDAVVYFCEEILPLIKQRAPDIRLLIVGMHPTRQVQTLAKKYSNYVTVTGKVDDVRPYFTEAELSIAPLRIGGGTRLKIVESMAMGRPVIATTVGCEGLAVEDEKHLLIRDDAQSFAEAVVRLLKDETLRRNLVEQGRRLVEIKYSWNYIAQTVADNWRHLTEKN